VIGQTRFTLHAAPDPALVPPQFDDHLADSWD
jgi:hypothetical protein